MSAPVSFSQFCKYYELDPTVTTSAEEYQAYADNLELMSNALDKQEGKPMEEKLLFDNVTIDLETLDTEPSSKILSIGIVPFNWGEPVSFEDLCNRNSSLYIKIKMDTVPYMFTESANTREWWEKQGEEARHVLAPSDLDMEFKAALLQVALHLKTWVKPLKKDGGQVFCRGYDFDGGILDHAFKAMGLDKPWGYNRFRCIRTTIDNFAGTRNGYVRERNPEGFIKHHALHDAAKDTLTMLTLTVGRK